MKTSTFLRKAAIILCLAFSFTTVKALDPFAAPTGTQWLVYDFEAGMGSYFSWWANYDCSEKGIVDNPFPEDAVNSTAKCIKIEKSGIWGSFGPFVDNGYFDLSEWEKIAVDVLIMDGSIGHYKLEINTGNGWPNLAELEKWDAGIPAGEWRTITWDIQSLISAGTITTTTDVSVFCRLYINGGAKDFDVYVDNYRLLRTNPSQGTNLNDVKSTTDLTYNRDNQVFSLSNVKGNVAIYNTAGNIVGEINNYNGEAVSVAQYPNGLYIIKANQYTFKFVK